jgi:hypothetical protein
MIQAVCSLARTRRAAASTVRVGVGRVLSASVLLLQSVQHKDKRRSAEDERRVQCNHQLNLRSARHAFAHRHASQQRTEARPVYMSTNMVRKMVSTETCARRAREAAVLRPHAHLLRQRECVAHDEPEVLELEPARCAKREAQSAALLSAFPS